MQFGGIGSGIYGPNGGLYGWLESYGSLTLTDSSPVQSFVEPFTLDEVKSKTEAEFRVALKNT